MHMNYQNNEQLPNKKSLSVPFAQTSRRQIQLTTENDQLEPIYCPLASSEFQIECFNLKVLA